MTYPLFLTDVDDTVIPFRGGYPQARGVDLSVLVQIRLHLERLKEAYGLNAVAVTNMPAGQLPGLIHTLFGNVAARFHWSESGAVRLDMHAYSNTIHPAFTSWVRLERQEIICHFAQWGLEGMEPGLLVNIIFSNPEIGERRPAPEFEERVRTAAAALDPEILRKVKITAGQDGNMADVRPIDCVEAGWSKITAFDDMVARYPDVDLKASAFAGDGGSDVVMAHRIAMAGGFVIAVGNACAEMQEIASSSAGYVSSAPCEHGLLEALPHYEKHLKRCARHADSELAQVLH